MTNVPDYIAKDIRNVTIDGQRGTFFPEDPGYEFLRILDEDVANGGCKPHWMTSEFFEEERHQYKLAVYKGATLFDKFLIIIGIHHDDFDMLKGPPKRKDGSTIKYNDMRSEDFYRIPKFKKCRICGEEHELESSPSKWCKRCREYRDIILEYRETMLAEIK